MSKSDMKNTIKSVSIDLLYKKGYFATSISDIARAAGIQKSSIYYHYSNKEDILFDILKTTASDINESIDKCLTGVKSAEESLRIAIQNHIFFHIDRQKEAIISDSEVRGLTIDNYKTIIQKRDEYDRKIQSIIKMGIDEGIFLDMDFKILSYAIITMCTAVCMWFNLQGRLSKEETAKIYTDFILNGLKREHTRSWFPSAGDFLDKVELIVRAKGILTPPLIAKERRWYPKEKREAGKKFNSKTTL